MTFESYYKYVSGEFDIPEGYEVYIEPKYFSPKMKKIRQKKGHRNNGN